MNKGIFVRKLSALLCALVLAFSLLPVTSAAAGTPEISRNIGRNNYTVYGSIVASYLYANDKGGLTRVENEGHGVVVEEYSSDFTLLNSRILPSSNLSQFTLWGGFFAGETYNFLILGKQNPNEDDNVEVIRVIKFSKDWEELGHASLYGANTVYPFYIGSLRCDENNGCLYIRTCHRMYATWDGVNHQANMTILIQEDNMEVLASYDKILNSDYGYVSHSFNQFILIDCDGKVVALDHGDAYPRGAQLLCYDPVSDVSQTALITAFPGEEGENETGASLGGLEETSSGYVTAYCSNGTGAGYENRTVYFSYTPKSNFSAGSTRTVTLSSPAASTPVLAPTGLDGGWILWNGMKDAFTPNDILYYARYSSDGSVGPVQTATAPLSDCKPIYYNGKVLWYAADHSAPIFYTLDASGVTAHPVGEDEDSSEFNDVTTSHWAYPYIQKVVDQGFMEGTGGNQFSPDTQISYAEFATMLVRAFYSGEEGYAQSDGEAWYVPYLKVASDHGILNLTPVMRETDWAAHAADHATRWDMANMLYSVLLDQKIVQASAATWYDLSKISDWDSIPSRAKDAVATCYAGGILSGTGDGAFHGERSMTRAEACVVLVRMDEIIHGNR